MSKHTPGPWEVLETRTSLLVHHKSEHTDGGYFAEVQSMNPGATEAWETAVANARLIAAAPTMLEQLEAILAEDDAYIQSDDMYPDYLNDRIAKIREVVRKAKGE